MLNPCELCNVDSRLETVKLDVFGRITYIGVCASCRAKVDNLVAIDRKYHEGTKRA